MANKQISRIKSAITGEEYDLVTRYQDETMSIKLSCADDITWTDYKVLVQNITTGAYSEHTLLATGECSFAIPMGETYEVTLPSIGDTYTQPLARTFVAQVGFRSISYEYTAAADKEEQVNIIIKIKTTGGAMSDIAGQIVTATLSDGQTKSATISDTGTATLNIPYGVYYTLAFPTVSGYTHDHMRDTFLAGIPSRNEVVFYYLLTDSKTTGVFGIDSNGNQYSLAEIQTMSDEDKAKIILGGFYDDALGDNGFCWKIKEPCGPLTAGASSPLISIRWANNNTFMLVDSEGKYKPLNQTDENCPFYNEDLSNDAGGLKYFNNGSEYTDLILKAAEEMIAAGTAPANFTTPAATYCRQQELITTDGRTRKGFLPAYGQIRRLAINFSDLQALYNALNIATTTINYTPTITTGYWWTSCQNSRASAVYLNIGSFNSCLKTYSFSVLVCYDL